MKEAWYMVGVKERAKEWLAGAGESPIGIMVCDLLDAIDRSDARYGTTQVELNKLREEFTRLESLTQWKPISEAPKDGTQILLYERDNIYIGYWYNFKNGIPGDGLWSRDLDNDEYNKPTHWMYLPKPPKMGDE